MAKRGLIGIVMTVWVLFSMIVIPLYTLSLLERGISYGGQLVKISVVRLNVGMITLLGLIAMMLTAFSYAFGGKVDAFLTFIKYMVVAYYEWTWAQGIKELEITVDGYIINVGIYLDPWIMLVIAGSLLLGLIKAIYKFLEAKEESES